MSSLSIWQRFKRTRLRPPPRSLTILLMGSLRWCRRKRRWPETTRCARSTRRCGARRRLAHQRHTHTDECHACPACRAHYFAQNCVTQERYNGVTESRSWHHVTVISPRKDQQVADEENQQEEDAQPDCLAADGLPESRGKRAQRTEAHRSDSLHSLAEKDLPHRAE